MVRNRLRHWRPTLGPLRSTEGSLGVTSSRSLSGRRADEADSLRDVSDAVDEGDTVSLRSLFPRARFIGGDDILASGVVDDATQCVPGQVVVVTPLNPHPEQAVASALARGAAGILCEQLLPCPLPQCLVADAAQAAARLSAAVAGNPACDVYTVGVIGPAGKTSVALLTAAVLRAAGFRTAFDTDLGQSDGVLQSTPPARVDGPLEMTELLSTARDSGSSVVVLELSDAMLRSVALSGVELDLLVVTGNPVRGDHFGPRPLELALQRLRPSGVAVVSADSPQSVAAVRAAGAAHVTYGLRRKADVSAKIFEQLPGQTTLLVSARDCTAAMETSLTGPAMAANQLAAVAIGLLSELSLEQAIASVARVGKLPGRMERITGFDTAAVVLDAAATGPRLSSTLRGLRRERSNGRLWCIVAADTDAAGSIDASACAAMGNAAQRYADHVIFTTAAGGKATFLAQAHAMLDGVADPAAPRLIADRARAIQWAVSHAAPEDTILIAGGYVAAGPHGHRQAIEADRTAVEQARTLPQVARTRPPKILRFPGLVASAGDTRPAA